MNEQELKEYRDYLVSQGATPEEAFEYMQYQKIIPTDEKSLAKLALEGVGRALDYTGGLGRTAVGGLRDVLTLSEGDERTIRDGDWVKALKGEAVHGEEILKRAGVDELGSVDLMREMTIPFTDFKIGEGTTSGRDALGFGLDIASDPLTYLTLGGSAAVKGLRQAVKPGTSTIKETLQQTPNTLRSLVTTPSRTLNKAGKDFYKAGLKKIDQEAVKYGKEPVSELLMENRIVGNASQIYDQMDELGKKLLKERNDILQNASDQGARVSMKDAMDPLRQRVAQIKASRDPNLQGMVDALESTIKKYEGLEQAAYTPIERLTPSSTEFLEMPYTKFEPGYQKVEITPPKTSYQEKIGGIRVEPKKDPLFLPLSEGEKRFNIRETLNKFEPIRTPGKVTPGEVIDPSYVPQSPLVGMYDKPAEITFGKTIPEQYITPMQASGYKTSVGLDMPDSSFRDGEILNQIQRASKDKYQGLKNATEESVWKTIGEAEAQKLKDANSKLGQILTTKDKQFVQKQIEDNKNIITSVDGIVLATDPATFAAKKTADILKTTGARTRGGRYMMDKANGKYFQPVMDNALRGLLIDGARPENMSVWEDIRQGK